MSRTLIIAEAGVNHNGSIELAKNLIDAAALAGADIVKFQTFKAENIVSKNAVKAQYQQNNSGAIESQFEMLQRLELSEEDHIILQTYCKTKNIEFWSTAFDIESIRMLHRLGIKRWKIPSGDITNLPFLRQVGAFGQEIILSTGMSEVDEIGEALSVLIASGTPKNNICILHCNTEYPTPMEDVNLRAMQTIKDTFGVKTGYSDHTNGIEVATAAVALGATVIEKHFTLDRTMEGPDHKASLEPKELASMVTAIRNIEKALGDGLKKVTLSERKNMSIARKSIHICRDIIAGQIITMDDLCMKRPGDGISPMQLDSVIGKNATVDLPADHKLSLKDFI